MSIFEQDEEKEGDDILSKLYEYIQGDIMSWDLENSDSFINEVRKRNPISDSIVIFESTEKQFLADELNLDESDIWVYETVTGYYGGNQEFSDYSTVLDDFTEGYYGYYHLNENNMNTLKTISSYILPGAEFDIEDSKFRFSFNKRMYELFSDEVEGIVHSVWEADEQMYYDAIKADIKKTFDLIEKRMGFAVYNDRISSTVGELIMWCRFFDYEGDLKGLYEKIINKFTPRIKGGWGEYYDFYDLDYLDVERLNLNVEHYLDKIIEKFEDSDINYEEFSKFVSRITKNSNIDTWHRIPKNPNYQYKIVSFDPERMKVKVQIAGKLGMSERSLTEEGFYNLLYDPELFEIQ